MSAPGDSSSGAVRDRADVDRLSAVAPPTLDWPSTSYEVLRRGAARWPNAAALTFLPDPADPGRAERLSYAQLLRGVTQAANVFASLGVGRSDVAAYALPNLPQTHLALWGAEAAGTAFAINPAQSAGQVVALLARTRARVLVTTAETWTSLCAHDLAAGGLRHVLLVGAAPAGTGDTAGFVVEDFDTALPAADGNRLAGPPPDGADDSSWFCTGGTTGDPKIARRRHSGEVANMAAFAAMLGDHARPGRVWLCGLPLFHVNAIAVTGLLPWMTGGEVLLAGPAGYRDSALIREFWRIVEAYRVNVFSGVPTIYARLLQQPAAGRDLSSLDFAICGAAPLSPALFERFEAATGVRILEGYGLTEGGCMSTMNPLGGERRIGSVGLSAPWQALKVMATDGGEGRARECPTGEVGAVVIAGPNLFDGYLQPKHEAGAWVDLDDGRRGFDTGDLGRLDADGYLWLAGRRKELIIRGGHNIDPAVIEEALQRHRDVVVCAAVGRPHRDLGEVPVAYVQLRDGAAADAAALLAYVAAAAPERAAVPVAVRILPVLPTTPVGKLFKPALRHLEVADLVREEASALHVALDGVEVVAKPEGGLLCRIAPAAAAAALAVPLSDFGLEAAAAPPSAAPVPSP